MWLHAVMHDPPIIGAGTGYIPDSYTHIYIGTTVNISQLLIRVRVRVSIIVLGLELEELTKYDLYTCRCIR